MILARDSLKLALRDYASYFCTQWRVALVLPLSLKPKAICEKLQVTPTTLRRWGAKGAFGVVRLIGHRLEAIYALLKQHNLDFARLSEAIDPCRAEIEVTQIVCEGAKCAEYS